MADIDNQQNIPLEQPVDPVEQALDDLEQRELSHAHVLQNLDALKEKIATEKLSVSREQLQRLRGAMMAEIEYTSSEEDSLKLTESLDALEIKLLSLEGLVPQQADRRPEWMKKSAGMFADMLMNFRKVPGVGETLDWIGDMTGKTLKSSEDLWAWVKGAVLEQVASGAFFKNEKIQAWARQELFRESAIAGVSQAVKDIQAKKIPNLTLSIDVNSWNNVTDAASYQQALSLYDPTSTDNKLLAMQYAAQFINGKVKNADGKACNVIITAAALAEAALSKPVRLDASKQAMAVQPAVAPALSAAPAVAPVPPVAPASPSSVPVASASTSPIAKI
jgi:hypothetical protein